jgi:hypothetical protein
MAAEGADNLFIELLGSADGFVNMMDDAVASTEDAANRLARSSNEMAETVGRDLEMAADGWKNFTSTAVNNSSMVIATLADLYTAYQSYKLSQAGAAGTGAGGAAGMFGTIGASATTLTAALGTLAITLGGVTYALSGWEGVLRIPGNLLEGLKYILYGVTLGMVDLTEATTRQKGADQAWADQVRNNRQLMMEKEQQRLDMYNSLSEAVAKLSDHSAKAEEKFAKKFVGDLGQVSGVSELTKQIAEGMVAREFADQRIAEHTAKLEQEATTYKMTRGQIANYILELNGATQAQRQEMLAVVAKMDAIDAAEAKRKEDEKRAKEMEREAKRRAEEAKREHDRLVEEGRALHDALRTPMEKLIEDAKRAQELFKLGVINAEDLARAMKRLEEGPKEIRKHIKFITSRDIGVETGEFGSIEDLAAREAYRQNLMAMKPKRDVAGVDADVRRRGLVPVHRAVDGVPLTKEELETRKVLNEMHVTLRIIAARVDPKLNIRLQPAKIGGGK